MEPNPLRTIPSVWKSYLLLFQRANSIAYKRLEDHYRQKGLEVRHIWIMVAARDRPATQGRIAEALGINTNVMVHVVDDMESRGLIKRIRNPENRRECILKVSAKGVRAIEIWERDFDKVSLKVFKPLTLKILDEMRDHALAIIDDHYSADE